MIVNILESLKISVVDNTKSEDEDWMGFSDRSSVAKCGPM